MTVIERLDPPLPLDTPRGRAWAHFLLDYGHDHNLVWVCFLRETGECWAVSNPEVRLPACETTRTRIAETGRQTPSQILFGERDMLTQRVAIQSQTIANLMAERDDLAVAVHDLETVRDMARALPAHSQMSTVRQLRAWGYEHPALGAAGSVAQGGEAGGRAVTPVTASQGSQDTPQPVAATSKRGRGSRRPPGR